MALALAASAALAPARRAVHAATEARPSDSAGAPVVGEGGLVTVRLSQKELGLVLEDDPSGGGGVVVRRLEEGSEALAAGVLPLARLVEVDGRNVRGVSAAEAVALLRRAGRPAALTFDVSAYQGLAPDRVVEKAAGAQQFDTARVGITRLDGNGKATSPPPPCGLASRESDVLEISYVGTVQSSPTTGRGVGYEFDSSERRCGLSQRDMPVPW